MRNAGQLSKLENFNYPTYLYSSHKGQLSWFEGIKGPKEKVTAKRNEDVDEKKRTWFLKKKSTKHFGLNNFLCPKTTRWYDPKLYWLNFSIERNFSNKFDPFHESDSYILYITSAEIDWISFTTKRYCSSIFSIAQPHNIIDIEKWYTFQAPKSISRAIFPDFEERAREKGVPKCGLKRLSF